MTFNLRRDTRFDKHRAWSNRREAVVDVVLDQAPDLLATQEGTLSMLRDLDDGLPGYERVGGAREHWPGEEPNAVYYDPERLAVLDAGVFWLNRTPLRPRRTWGDWARRSALWALVVHRETGAPLLVVNTHFDHVSIVARRRSALLLRRLAPEAIVMGDFNAWPRRFVHSVLLEGRWDPLARGHRTHNVFTGRNRGRIDWILLPEGMRARKAAILQPKRGNGEPVSDHYPVVVDVEPPVPRARVPAPTWTWPSARGVPTKLPPAPDMVGASAREAAQPAEAKRGDGERLTPERRS